MHEEKESGTDRPNADGILLAIGTAAPGRGAEVARTLVEERVIACANIMKNVQSLYIWNDRLVEESEELLFMKLNRGCADLLRKRFRELHHYEVPELLIVEVVDGLEDYLLWVRNTVPSAGAG